MKIRVPDYFKNFKCIASECEDTCCAGWGIVIDEETNKYYQEVDGDFGLRLKREIVNEDGENVFILKNNNCPFLNENKLCDIYSELGEDGLCYTCKQYPRYTEDFIDLRETGVSLSCPEAARLILKDSKKAEFEISENDEKTSLDNDMNKDIFEDIYKELIKCREIIIDIIQDRKLDLANRASIMLIFANEIQDKLDLDDIEAIKEVRDKYRENTYIQEVIQNIDKYKGKEDSKYNNVYEYFKVFKELKHINPNDPLGLDNALRYFWQSEDDKEIYMSKHKKFNAYYKESSNKLENILVYFVFRYFMKAIFDYDVISKIKLAVVSTLMINELSVVRFIENDEFTDDDMVDISHMYSKDIEHLEENIEALSEEFEENDVFKYEEIIVNLMNFMV